MKTLSINIENDIVRGADGNIAVSKDLQACRYVCEQAMQGIKGEMIYAKNAGIPYFQLIFTNKPKLRQFEAQARRVLLDVDGVVKITRFISKLTGEVLQYQVDIESIYGQFYLKK
jgi:hypothetical protein